MSLRQCCLWLSDISCFNQDLELGKISETKLKITNDESYESLAATYQYQLIKILDEVLQRHQVPAELRQEICGDYAFDSGTLHDQGRLNLNKIDYQPIVAFKTRGTLKLPHDAFDFHDYAFGNTSEYFEQRET